MTAPSAPISIPRPQRQLADYGRTALRASGVAGALMLIGLIIPGQRAQFFRSYLTAYLLFLGISLGCLALVMLHHLVGGAWGLLVRRISEAAAALMTLLTLLFLPILLGVRYLFPWANARQVSADPILQHKALYLNVPFWLARTCVYFTIWSLLSHLLRRWSRQQDMARDPEAAGRMASLSAPGLLLFFVTMTLASVDWIMSREPHWYSSVQGLLTCAGQGLSGIAFIIAMLALISQQSLLVHQPQLTGLITTDERPFGDLITPGRLNDLGNLLLTLVILWAYMALAQFIVIWMGNTNEEIPWYTQRGLNAESPNAWRWFALVLVVLHFFVPFVLLLSKENKRQLTILGTIAGSMLVLRHLDMIWLTAPTVTGPDAPESAVGGPSSWMDVVAPVAIGGVWFAGFVRALESRALIPPHDPLTPDLLVTDEGHEAHSGQSEAASHGTRGAAAVAIKRAEAEGGSHA